MTWVRLDDKFPEHPKVEALDDSSAWLYVKALCYANRNLTDGFIPVAAAARLGGSHYKRSAQRLMAAGLWDGARDGYTIHDYHDFQPTRERVIDGRTAAAKRMRNLRSQDVRANVDRTSREVQLPRTQSRSHGSIEPSTRTNEENVGDLRGVLKAMP